GQTGLDPFLVLVERAGQIVAQDDDSGGNQNARIVYKSQETGAFRVYATTFMPGMTGAFRLTISHQGGAAPAAARPAHRALPAPSERSCGKRCPPSARKAPRPANSSPRRPASLQRG